MNELLPEIERRRLRSLVDANLDAAEPLHADDYQLITPNGSELTKADYMGDIASGRLRYTAFEPVSTIRLLGDSDGTGDTDVKDDSDGDVAVLRYRARISFDSGPGIVCWHTDCYRKRNGRWQAVWSQATRIEAEL